MKNKFFYLGLSLIFVLSLSLRLYKYNTPLADWHSWRQADTASVTREFVKNNYPLWLPHYHDLSNIPSGLNNLTGWRMVELPLPNYFLSLLIKAQPQLELVSTSRISSAFFSSLSVIILSLLIFQLSKNKNLSLLTGLVMASMPYAVYYGRVILPEPYMIFFQLLSLYSLIYYLKKQNLLSLIISLISLSLAFLLKPTSIFLLPVYLGLSFAYLGKKTFKTWPLYLFILTILPTLWWRHWIQNFPEGIPANKWLLNGNGIRLRPAWWRWLFADRLARLILGYWGVVFLILGVIPIKKIKLTNKLNIFILSYIVAMLSYLIVFATGNVQHDYYQILLIPIISLLVAKGIMNFYQLIKINYSKLISLGLTSFLALLCLFLGIEQVRGYYNINNPAIVAAGKRVDEILPKDAKVITPYSGDTAFLFQTNRLGWPVGTLIEEKIALGAEYYVTVSYDDEARQLEEKYELIEKTPQYLIIKLK